MCLRLMTFFAFFIPRLSWRRASGQRYTGLARWRCSVLAITPDGPLLPLGVRAARGGKVLPNNLLGGQNEAALHEGENSTKMWLGGSSTLRKDITEPEHNRPRVSPLGTRADMFEVPWGAPAGWDTGRLFSNGIQWCGILSGHKKSLESIWGGRRRLRS